MSEEKFHNKNYLAKRQEMTELVAKSKPIASDIKALIRTTQNPDGKKLLASLMRTYVDEALETDFDEYVLTRKETYQPMFTIGDEEPEPKDLTDEVWERLCSAVRKDPRLQLREARGCDELVDKFWVTIKPEYYSKMYYILAPYVDITPVVYGNYYGEETEDEDRDFQ